MEEYKKGIIKRKIVHMLFGTLFFMLYFMIPMEKYVSLLFVLSMSVIIAYSLNLFEGKNIISYLVNRMSKENEFLGEGLLFMVSSFIVGSIILDKELFFLLFWLITISDGFSTIIGISYGKKINKHLKSKEGFIAYVLSATPLLLFYENIFFILFVILSSGVIELIEEIEDNIGIAFYLSLINKFI